MSEWPEEPDLSGWESLRGPVAWAYNILREEGGDDERKVATMIPLRDRIADLLAHHPAFNFKDEGYSAEDVLMMADAVIRELKLREDRVGLLVRHVTEWQNSE